MTSLTSLLSLLSIWCLSACSINEFITVESDMSTSSPEFATMVSNTSQSSDLSFSSPPLEMDALVDLPDPNELPEPEENFALCVDAMKRTLQTSYQRECAHYTDMDQQDRASLYHTELIFAACLYLDCEGRVIEGHNGVMIGKSCKDLDDLLYVLTQAAEEALNDEGCVQPTYQTRLLSWDDFMGGESCDQLSCSIGPDGVLVRGSK